MYLYHMPKLYLSILHQLRPPRQFIPDPHLEIRLDKSRGNNKLK
jgi:hypothetical protein